MVARNEVSGMRLTWRDGVATLLVGGAVGMYAAYLADAALPLLSGPRVLALAVFALGITTCALAGSGMTSSEGFTRYARWMGRLALVPGLAFPVTLVTGNEIALAVLVGGTAAMWALATVRHAIHGKPDQVSDRALRQLIEREQSKARHPGRAR
jgi:hypothetical protein